MPSERNDKKMNEEDNAGSFTVPDWQIKLGKEELKNIAEGNAGLMDWNETRKQFKN